MVPNAMIVYIHQEKIKNNTPVVHLSTPSIVLLIGKLNHNTSLLKKSCNGH